MNRSEGRWVLSFMWIPTDAICTVRNRGYRALILAAPRRSSPKYLTLCEDGRVRWLRRDLLVVESLDPDLAAVAAVLFS